MGRMLRKRFWDVRDRFWRRWSLVWIPPHSFYSRTFSSFRIFFPLFPLYCFLHFCWHCRFTLSRVLLPVHRSCIVLSVRHWFAGEIDPSSPHSGIQYGDTPIYSNPPSLFGTSPGTMTFLGVGNGHPRGKIRLGRQRRETSNSVLGEWGEVFSSGNRRGGCCSWGFGQSLHQI